jgi:hypothetical protein
LPRISARSISWSTMLAQSDPRHCLKSLPSNGSGCYAPTCMAPFIDQFEFQCAILPSASQRARYSQASCSVSNRLTRPCSYTMRPPICVVLAVV